MGNAFGMIPGLETDEWSNDACRGYATELMEVLGKEESLARIRKGIELLSQAQ